jgi:glycine cleavage system transcriptional repressor
MDNYLVITALGQDHPGIVDKLSEAVLDSGCNVVDSRMTVLGGEFAVILMVSGKWNELAKLEDSLPALREQLGLMVVAKRTERSQPAADLMPYTVEVIAIDHPGIVFHLARFFSSQGAHRRPARRIPRLLRGTEYGRHPGTQQSLTTRKP